MKKANQILAIAVVGSSILTLQSCKKYEDGPFLSLRSKTARLTGEWEFTAGNQSRFDKGQDIVVDFRQDGECTLKLSGYFTYNIPYNGYGNIYYSVTFEGEWEWIDKKEGIEIHLSYDNGYNLEDLDYNWVISRLTNKELNVTDQYEGSWEFEKK